MVELKEVAENPIGADWAINTTGAEPTNNAESIANRSACENLRGSWLISANKNEAAKAILRRRHVNIDNPCTQLRSATFILCLKVSAILLAGLYQRLK